MALSETGQTAEEWHKRKTKDVVPELDPPMDPSVSGAKGGRGNKGSANRASFSSRNKDTSSTLARLKRDYPDLAALVRCSFWADIELPELIDCVGSLHMIDYAGPAQWNIWPVLIS